MEFTPIGTIHTPYKTTSDMPIQPCGAAGVGGHIELNPELLDGLKDLDGFSHLIVLYHFHRVSKSSLTVTPFLDAQPHGVFATRAPTRPNPIGLSVLKLLAVEGHRLRVENVDMLDETPLLDIKPFVPTFDQPAGDIRCGWLQETSDRSKTLLSDRRFD